jgi:hypothetical protein
MRPSTLPLTLVTVLFLAPRLAIGDTIPSRTSGLWETSISMGNGIPNQTIKECVDQSTDAEGLKTGTEMPQAMGGTCSKNTFKRTSSGFESESECTIGGSTISSKGTFTGDFASSYKGEVVTTHSPPIFGNGGSKTVITAKHLGPCAADMKPGDLIMGNGMKMNRKEAAAQAEMLAKSIQNHLYAAQEEAPFGGDLGQAMSAAQGQMKAEELKVMQDAMQEMEDFGK